MQMTLRWYGSKYDTVTLKQIRQIPGVTGVISTLYGTAPGEVWEMDDILALKTEIEAAGLQLAGIESVNIHDAIKIGSPDREQYIENYITTLERLGQAGIHMVCYNFMPVFDWTRTELARMRPDGANQWHPDAALGNAEVLQNWCRSVPEDGSTSSWRVKQNWVRKAKYWNRSNTAGSLLQEFPCRRSQNRHRR